MFDFLTQAGSSNSLQELADSLEKRLAQLGFEKFALGLIPPLAQPTTTIILENLGDAWWSVASPGAHSRRQFVRLVREASAPFLVPPRFHEGVNDRLHEQGKYSTNKPSLVVPTETKIGIAYLLVSGNRDQDVNDTELTIIRELAVISVHNWQRLISVTAEGVLTKRERETLSLAASGLSSQQIAVKINVTERTVIAHIVNSMRKLDARNRTAAVVQAFKRGLIEI